MPYCENCGSQINLNAKFCGNCGAAQNPVATPTPVKPSVSAPPAPTKRERLSYYSPPSPTAFQMASPAPPIMQPSMVQAAPSMQPAAAMPQAQASSEPIYGVILFRRVKSLGRWDTYTGVLTSQRLIFAQMTNEMIKTASQESREKAKSEGKGFFGQWGDQLKATWGYSQKYLDMPPEAILAETPGNFALYNNTISMIEVKVDQDQDGQTRDLKVEIHSTAGKYEYHMNEDSNLTNLLKQVYGDRVKMPFGYFNKTINIR
jgi:hypothetical protein